MLKVEGMTNYILENKYIERGVSGASESIDHTSILTQILNPGSNVSNGELAVIWLDLANAYGTDDHNL